ncbi:hypothetical protein F5B20DRAFT_579486 [Whalleya microplaca]|nr:hypothetical protein F5B20DRAFT_579486 [Whalleya microplaca]
MLPTVYGVEIDGAKASVAQFQFATKAYFAVTAATTPEAWTDIIDQKVGSIWVFALPTLDGNPNSWKIGFKLDDDRIITIELYDTKTSSGVVLLARPITDDPSMSPDAHMAVLTKIRATGVGRRMKDNVSVRDIVLKIQEAGLLKYELLNGRGHRFWVFAVLGKIQDFVVELLRAPRLQSYVDELMQSSWMPGGRKNRSKTANADGTISPLILVPGKWVRKWVNGEEV